MGIVKVDTHKFDEVLEAMKFFTYKDIAGQIWHCRGLPYLPEIRGVANLELVNSKHNVLIDFKYEFNED